MRDGSSATTAAPFCSLQSDVVRCARLCRLASLAALIGVSLLSAQIAIADRSQLPKEAVTTIPVPMGMQDVAFDARRQQLYVQYVRTVDGEEVAGIQRYDLRIPSAPQLLDDLQESAVLGHQGLSLESTPDGDVKLWGSMGQGSGRYAIRFRYEAQRAPAEVERFELFDEGFVDTNVTMPEICSSGATLIARGRKSVRNQVIRIFDLQAVKKNGAGSLVDRFSYEWTIDPSLFKDGLPLQGIACNDKRKRVYLVAGRSEVSSNKRIYVYDFEGRLLHRIENFSLGIEHARMENGSYEPEGMTYLVAGTNPGQMLALSIVSGRGRSRTLRLWPIDSLLDH